MRCSRRATKHNIIPCHIYLCPLVKKKRRGSSAATLMITKNPDGAQDRDAEASRAEQEAAGSSAGGNRDNAGGFVGDLLGTSYSFQAPGTGDMRHGTEGWRCLETSFKAGPSRMTQ